MFNFILRLRDSAPLDAMTLFLSTRFNMSLGMETFFTQFYPN